MKLIPIPTHTYSGQRIQCMKLQWSTQCQPGHWEMKANYSVKFLLDGWLDLIASHQCSCCLWACAEWWGSRADSGWDANYFGAASLMRHKSSSLQSGRDQSCGPSTTVPFGPTAGQSNWVSLGGARGLSRASLPTKLLCRAPMHWFWSFNQTFLALYWQISCPFLQCPSTKRPRD